MDRHPQSGAILWFTGLSGSGKSTLANEVARRTIAYRPVEILDGDDIRRHLSAGLGFSRQDRDTNVRRIGFVARLLARHGVLAITAAISPYRDVRSEIRRSAEDEQLAFIEVYLNPSLASLVTRDPKGLYRRALAGDIAQFTGVSDPYEPPVHPDLEIATHLVSVESSVERILSVLHERQLIPQLPSDHLVV